MAAGLVATAAVTLTALFALAVEANRTAGDLMHATMLARQTLEALRRPAGAALPPTGADVVDRSGQPLTAATAPFGHTFERRWRSEALAASVTLIHVEVGGTVAGRRHPVRTRLTGLVRVAP